MLGKSKSFIAPKEKGFTHVGYLYWIIVSYLLAWQTRSLAGEVCIRKHVGYCSFNVTIELFIKELRRKQKLRDNSKVLANALLIITVKPSLNAHPKWLLLWWGWSLWESNCGNLGQQKLVFQTHLFYGENVLKQVNRFVSHSSSHTLSNVHCITYSEHRQQSIVMSGGCLEEAENNKKF